jgi:Zn finger protein HypA/HybF involved in hydrogenase expression
MPKVDIPQKLTCLKCGHTWIPRKTDVRLCPRCKTAYWDRAPKQGGDEATDKDMPSEN